MCLPPEVVVSMLSCTDTVMSYNKLQRKEDYFRCNLSISSFDSHVERGREFLKFISSYGVVLAGVERLLRRFFGKKAGE